MPRWCPTTSRPSDPAPPFNKALLRQCLFYLKEGSVATTRWSWSGVNGLCPSKAGWPSAHTSSNYKAPTKTTSGTTCLRRCWHHQSGDNCIEDVTAQRGLSCKPLSSLVLVGSSTPGPPGRAFGAHARNLQNNYAHACLGEEYARPGTIEGAHRRYLERHSKGRGGEPILTSWLNPKPA